MLHTAATRRWPRGPPTGTGRMVAGTDGAAGMADLRDYLDGEKNRGGSPAANQLEQQLEALSTNRFIDVA